MVRRKPIQILMMILFLLVAVACNNNKDTGFNDNSNDNGYGRSNVDDSISSMNTTLSSRDYPHTEPVLMQGAKYDFRIVDGRHAGQFAFDGRNMPSVTPKAPRQGGQAQQQAQLQQPQQGAQTQQKQQPQATPSAGISAVETQVIQLTNAERRKNGLPDLQADTPLGKVAREKANDMQTNHYFSHTSPTYGTPFDMMRDFGVGYRAAGENIAQGQRTAEEVVQAWMNSEGHRKNILSANFTHIGVGHSGEGNYWSQMFIGK